VADEGSAIRLGIIVDVITSPIHENADNTWNRERVCVSLLFCCCCCCFFEHVCVRAHNTKSRHLLPCSSWFELESRCPIHLIKAFYRNRHTRLVMIGGARAGIVLARLLTTGIEHLVPWAFALQGPLLQSQVSGRRSIEVNLLVQVSLSQSPNLKRKNCLHGADLVLGRQRSHCV
jgi:hypothetical protein